MTTSEFTKYQEDQCVEDGDFEITGGEECRDCTPNPDAFVPDWTLQELKVPFKNEKTCQYCVVLQLDANGEFVNADNISDVLDRYDIDYTNASPEDEQSIMAQLGNAMEFANEAYNIFLETYGRLDPRGAIILDDPNQPLRDQTIEQAENYQELIKSIGCEEALLSTEQTISVGTPYKFLVCVPCESIDSLEEKPTPRDPKTFHAESQVVLKGKKLFAQLKRLSFTLAVFERYTINNKDFELFFIEEEIPWDVKLYGASGPYNVYDVYLELADFLAKNDYSLGMLRGDFFANDQAEEIKIVFDDSDPKKPFVIDKIYAKKRWCEFEELTKDLGFLETGLLANQTVMGYLSDINDIDAKLSSPNPPSWIDFLVDHTFPQIDVRSKTTGELVDGMEDNPVNAFFADSLDRAFNTVSTFMSDVISDTFNEWSQQNCAMTRGFGGPEDDEDLYDLKDAKAQWQQYWNAEDSYKNLFKRMDNDNDQVRVDKSKTVKILEAFGLCGTNAALEKAIRCMLRGMSLNQFLKLQAKTYLKKLQPEAIQLLSKSLPFSVSQKITESFIEDFAGAPLPWETNSPAGQSTSRNLKKENLEDFFSLDDGVKGLRENIPAYEAMTEYSNQASNNKLSSDEEVAQYQQWLDERQADRDTYTSSDANPDVVWQNENPRPDINDAKYNLGSTTADDGPVVEVGDDGETYQFSDFNPTYESSNRLAYENDLDTWEEARQENRNIGGTNTEYQNYLLNLQQWDNESTRIMGLRDESKSQSASYQTEADQYAAELMALQDKIFPYEGEALNKTLESMGYKTLAEYQRDYKLIQKYRDEGVPDEKIRRELKRDSLDQASLYRPVANLQAALTEAYTDQILKYTGIDDLQRVLDNIPDSIPIGPIANALKCPWTSLLYPPHTRFLGSMELYTAFDCHEGSRVKRPWIEKTESVNIRDALWNNLYEAFKKAIRNRFNELMFSLIKLAIDTLDKAVCNALGGLGDNLTDALNGGGDKGFLDTMGDAFSDNPDIPQNPRLLKDMTDKVLNNYGIKPSDCPDIDPNSVSEGYSSLYRAIGYALSVREMKELFCFRPDEQNKLTLIRVQRSIEVNAPCFRDSFPNPTTCGQFFTDISSAVSLQKKNEIRESIMEEDSLIPVYSSPCISRQRYEEWLEFRIKLLTDMGVPRGVAEQNVAGEDTNNADTLGKMLDAFNDIDGFIGDNMANDLSINDGPKFDDKGNLIDPSCYPPSKLLDYNSEDIQEGTDSLNAIYFDTIETNFVKDLTKGRMFSDGLLDLIMAATNGDGLSKHQTRSNLPIFGFRKRHFVGYESEDRDDKHNKAETFYPETVGKLYYDQISEDVLFDASLLTAEPDVLQSVSIDLGAALATDFLGDVSGEQEDPYSPEDVYPASYTLEFQQDWSNFDTDRSLFLNKNTMLTELILNEKDDITGFSTNQYRISSFRNWEKNLSGLGTDAPREEGSVVIKSKLDPSISGYIETNFDLTSKQEYPFRTTIFNNLLKGSFGDIGIDLVADVDTSFHTSVYGKTSELIYNNIKDMCYNDLSGEMNSGFKFGHDTEDILTEEDINYVDPEPNSVSYTKRRSEKILGRSQTDHPRVHFLDPEKHGGSYTRPRLYIEPPHVKGWMAVRNGIIPEVDACEPARRVLINTREIKKYVKDTTNKISRDPRLNNANDCIKLIPFDIIVSQQTRAQMEGIIKAAMRVYTTEAAIRSYPVFASVFSGFDGNFDDSFFELIAEKTIEDFYGRRGLAKRMISNGRYVNSFLEQCVQMYSRKFYSGEIDATEEGAEALSRLEESQTRYKYPSNTWLKEYYTTRTTETHQYPHRELTLEDMPYETYFDVPSSDVVRFWPLAVEEGLETSTAEDLNSISFEDKQRTVQEYIKRKFYLNALLYDQEGERIFVPHDELKEVRVDLPPGNLNLFIKKANKYFRFFTRTMTVRMMRKECMIIFKELLKLEFKYIMNSLSNSIDEKAEIFRTMQHFSTREGVFYGNNTDFGTLDSVIRTSIQGNVSSVPNNVSENFFNNIDLSEDQILEIKTKGCFIIQKYFRILDKEETITVEQEVYDPIQNRGLDLYNIVNPESFLEFVNTPLPEDSEFSFDSSLLISDLFGNLEIVYGIEGQEYVEGVIINTQTGEEAEPLPEDFPEDQLIPLGMKGESGIKKGIRLLYVPNESYYTKLLESNPDLYRIGEQIELQDYATTSDALSDVNYAGISEDYLLRKAYLTSQYISEDDELHPSLGLNIPITSVEIDVHDQELLSLENFSGDDYKCLLTKLIKTDEFKLLFEYCFPVKAFVGHNLVHTFNSFYMSLGMGEGERGKQEEITGKDPPSTPRTGQPEEDVEESLDDTKDLIRNIFANIYSSEDYQKTFEFDFDLDLGGLLGFVNLLVPSFRIGGHKNVRRPFNKDGNECEGPVGKLFGG